MALGLQAGHIGVQRNQYNFLHGPSDLGTTSAGLTIQLITELRLLLLHFPIMHRRCIAERVPGEQPLAEEQGRSPRSAALIPLPGVSGSVLAGLSNSFAPYKLGDGLSLGNTNA